ncbi:hypothetical protein BSL78_03030 [Apostichopus japonicus]|uniref:Uncharacterized protein n=1 Tax=Stichopus japonicus TaxID=307972 RepID=A0A2G8LII8_STIJA|nr:hypothetical protein BSL78_03030 [Apostichopus japonicus]
MELLFRKMQKELVVVCLSYTSEKQRSGSGGVLTKWESGTSTVFGSGKVNMEQWRCSYTLRSHSGDVLDLAWSPHDAWLATCSIDNNIIIWNALKFPETISVLRGHSGMVKGVSWDPIGKYLASQGDDKSLRVWRTLDWKEETGIFKPFHERFSSNIYTKSLKKGSSKTQNYTMCAIGRKDKSVSVLGPAVVEGLWPLLGTVLFAISNLLNQKPVSVSQTKNRRSGQYDHRKSGDVKVPAEQKVLAEQQAKKKQQMQQHPQMSTPVKMNKTNPVVNGEPVDVKSQQIERPGLQSRRG